MNQRFLTRLHRSVWKSKTSYKTDSLLERNNRNIPPCSNSVYLLTALNAIENTSTKKFKQKYKSFITNKEAARIVVDCIKKDIKGNDCLIEIDPGEGILTEELLINFPHNKLLLFVPDLKTRKKIFERTDFQKLPKFSLSDFSFYNFYMYFWESRVNHEATRYAEFVEILKSHCDEHSNLKIIGIFCHPAILRALFLTYSFQASMFSDYLNPTLYIFVPFPVYASIFGLSKHTLPSRLHILTNCFFDVTCLATAPKRCFKISFKLKYGYGPQRKEDTRQLYLLRFVPKDINYIQKMTGGKVIAFTYFLIYLVKTRKNSSLIAALEAFIPNCGEELIKNGFKVFDHPLSMTESQLYKAFEVFTSHADYESSIYTDEMKSGIDILDDDDLLKFQNGSETFGGLDTSVDDYKDDMLIDSEELDEDIPY